MEEKTIEQLEREKASLQEKLQKLQLQREIDELNRQIDSYNFPNQFKYYLKDDFLRNQERYVPTCTSNSCNLEDLFNRLFK